MQKFVPFDRALVEKIASLHPTPFYIYDAEGIRSSVRELQKAFSWNKGFKEYFAVKATPNPSILALLKQEGCGADCSSSPELFSAERSGIVGEDIMFSSNNTPIDEFEHAKKLGAIINLDDLSQMSILERLGLPEIISFRYNPGAEFAGGNALIGNPEEAKYGLTKDQLFEAYARAQKGGVKRFGLHTMLISNELDPELFVSVAKLLFEFADLLNQKLGITLEFVNFGGGLGIPYRPEQEKIDLAYVGKKIQQAYTKLITNKGLPDLKIYAEYARVITGPHGYLVTRAINHKDIYRRYVGVDACMANLMRPGMYGAYHHITVLGKENEPQDHVYDVVGSLCENNDKFAIQRQLPKIEAGDILVIHDAGAHGHAMGFNYNGKLRSAEFMLHADGSVEMIRRAETMDDYFSTVLWQPQLIK
jgi:diaminopimelate decarboxylase